MKDRNLDPARLHSERTKKIITSLKKYDYDALIVFKPDNVRYITNHRPLFFYPEGTFLRNAALVTEDGNCILFVDSADGKRCLETYSWLPRENIVPIAAGFDRDEPTKALITKVRGFLRRGNVVGLDASSFNVFLFMKDSTPGIQFVEGNKLINEARKIKGTVEIENLRRSGAISEIATEEAFHCMKPGIRECDVWAEVSKVVYSLGGESTHSSGIVASGKNGTYPSRLVTTRIIEKGELVYLDVGACFNGYFTDMARTVAVGKPIREQRELYQTVLRAKSEMGDALKAGNTTAAVAEAGKTVFQNSKYAKYSSVVGHGIGMSLAELPLIRPRDDPATLPETLLPGMVVAIEPAIWHPLYGGVRLEDTYLLSQSGKEKLTSHPSDGQLEQLPA